MGFYVIGNKTRAKVVKNKVAPPFKQAEFDIMYGLGISAEGALLDLATIMDVVDKSGAWYSYNDNRMGQGRENSKEFLKNNPEIAKEIEAKVRAGAEKLNLSATITETDDDADEILQDKEVFNNKK